MRDGGWSGSIHLCHVAHPHRNAEALAKMVVDRTNFELGVQPESNIVCFRYDSTRMEKDLNPMIRQRLIDDGKFYIVQTLLKDKFFLRVSLMNPLTEKQDLNYLLDEVERLANELNEK